MSTPADILVVIVPGLGSESLDPANRDTWPDWVVALYTLIASNCPGAFIMVGNYTDGSLPERVIGVKDAAGATKVMYVGHSDGGASGVWLQDHVHRLHEALVIAVIILLDDVTDVLRHGFLATLDPAIVLRCIRIFQTADPLIHSNSVVFSDPTVQVENLSVAGPPFNHPQDDHIQVAADPAVQSFILDRVKELVSSSAGTASP